MPRTATSEEDKVWFGQDTTGIAVSVCWWLQCILHHICLHNNKYTDLNFPLHSRRIILHNAGIIDAGLAIYHIALGQHSLSSKLEPLTCVFQLAALYVIQISAHYPAIRNCLCMTQVLLTLKLFLVYSHVEPVPEFFTYTFSGPMLPVVGYPSFLPNSG